MCSQKNILSGEGRGREVKIVASLPPTESWQIFLVRSIHKLLVGSPQDGRNPE